MTNPQDPVIEGSAGEPTGPRRLYRSSTNRSVAGVCGGLGEYLGIDVGVVRLLWLLSIALTLGITLLIYTALAFVIPQEPPEHAAHKVVARTDLWQKLRHNHRLLWGGLLLLIGAVLLLNVFGLLPWRLQTLWRFSWSLFWPILLIGAGVLLVLGFTGRAPKWRNLRQASGRLPFRRSRDDRVIAGVCGGLAQTLGIDSLVVRMAWILFSLLTVGTLAVVIYVLAAALIPVED